MILVHGGAGLLTEDRHERLRAGVRAAAAAGYAILAKGGTALDAVTEATRILEDDPEYNAGTGAALAIDGTVETDAAIMDGDTQRVGAVACVPDLGNAILLARKVMEAGEHVILAGPEVWKFAAEHGITPAPPGALVTERERMKLLAQTAIASASLPGGGTVGAVARDRAGKFAAATSTGGITGKRRGRIGDTPIPGAGTWADPRCAISATGNGEAVLRVALGRTISLHGGALEPAVIESLRELKRITSKTAGVIAIDATGWCARQLTEHMPFAWASVDGSGDSMGNRI